jgi:hypothetical protein
MSFDKTLNNGSVKLITQDKESNNRMRVISAKANPVFLARFCFSFGSLSEMIEINTILSIPKTISNMVSVSNATQVSGLDNNSII